VVGCSTGQGNLEEEDILDAGKSIFTEGDRMGEVHVKEAHLMEDLLSIHISKLGFNASKGDMGKLGSIYVLLTSADIHTIGAPAN